MVSHREPLTVPLGVDGTPVASSTLFSSVGATVVIVQSTIAQPEVPVSFISSYVGSVGAPTLASHLLLAPGGETRTRIGEHSERELSVWAGRGPLVLDHLFVFRELLAETFALTLPVLDA